MQTFSIKEAIRNGWEIVKKHFWFVVGVTLVYSLFNNGMEWGGEDGNGVWSWYMFAAALILGIIFAIIGTIIQIGYTRIHLKLQAGERPAFKELFTNWHPFWKYVGTMILYCLRVLVGFLLLIVPGIIWAIKFQFMPLLTIDRGLGPREAMRESARMTEGHKWHLLKFSLVVIGINLIGFLCLVVGMLVTIPFTILAHIHVYRKLS